jgi:predicted dehydrogenase
MKKLNIAIVGCGMWAQETHLPFLLSNNEKVNFCGIVDILDEQKKKELESKYNVAVYLSIKDLVTNIQNLDGVLVTTPHSLHYSMAKELIESGINVHIDKPMADTSNKIEELISLSKTKNIIISTHTQRKFMPGQSLLKWYLVNNFKEIYQIKSYFWQQLFNDYNDSWRSKKNLSSGGILMDSGFHCVDTIASILDITDVQSITDISFCTNFAGRNNDSYSNLMFKVDKTVVSIEVIRGVPKKAKREGFEIHGDAGLLTLDYSFDKDKKANLIFFDKYNNIEKDSKRFNTQYSPYPLQLFLLSLEDDRQSRMIIDKNNTYSKITSYILERAYNIQERG